jgi:hypothetical protein
MKSSRLIEDGPLPAAFQDREVPLFVVTKVEEEDNRVVLEYTLEAAGPPLFIRERNRYDELPEKVEVSVGAWGGTMGRWSLLERYVGKIQCDGASGLRQLFEEGRAQDFVVEKGFFRKRVTFESFQVGMWRLKCRRVIPLSFTTLVFDKSRHVWVAKDPFLKDLGLT